MATREVIQKEFMDIFDQYSYLFEECKITRVKFLGWMEGFEKYAELRKAYNYLRTKMLPLIEQMRIIWSHKTQLAWNNLKSMMPNHNDVKQLREKEFFIKECWQNRPKHTRIM